MSNLIIGACYGYDYNQVKCWLNSINRLKDTTGVLIIMDHDYQPLMDTIDKYNYDNIMVSFSRVNENNAPHVNKFFAITETIEDLMILNYDFDTVIATDVRDVVFQLSPFEYVSNKLKETNKKYIASPECLLYKDEAWGNNNFKTSFEDLPDLYVDILNKPIYNVGILASNDLNNMLKLTRAILYGALERTTKICDQAVYNHLIHQTDFGNDFYFANQEFAVNLGTTMDARKMHVFGPKLLDEPPTFQNNYFCYKDKPVYIAHQYDRTPFNHEVLKIYG